MFMFYFMHNYVGLGTEVFYLFKEITIITNTYNWSLAL